MSTQCVLCFLRLVEHVAKAKDIVEQSKHIQQLDSENKILKKEREEMLKMHEDSMIALQESASAEINRLKEELAILKDQKQAADEQNLCHSEAFKLLQQEKESLADVVWQAKASIFSKCPPPCSSVVWILRIFELMQSLSEFSAPMGLTRSPPSDKECMILAGNFINTAIAQAKEIAKPLQIYIKASDSVVKYSDILRRAPERVASWKASCARAGARMALSMVKAHYEDADIDMVTSGIPDVDDDGKEIDHEAILSSLAGYDTRVAELVDVDVFVPKNFLDNADPESSESPHSGDAEGESPAGDDAASKSPTPKE